MTPYELAQKNLAARVAANGGMSSTQMMANRGTGSGPIIHYGTQQNNITPEAAAANAAASSGLTGSNAFFSQANAPMQPRTVSVTSNTGAGGANNSAAITSLLGTMRKQQEQMNADSLSQYNNLLATVSGAERDVEGLFANLGQTGETRIAQNQAQQRGRTEQDLITRGLGNTTIRQSALGAVDRDAEQARQSLGESINQQKIGTKLNLANMKGDALLSRQNVGPDQSLYLQLLQQLGKR